MMHQAAHMEDHGLASAEARDEFLDRVQDLDRVAQCRVLVGTAGHGLHVSRRGNEYSALQSPYAPEYEQLMT